MNPSQTDLASSGCAEALRSLKAGKNIFMTVVLLVLLTHLGSFLAVQFGGVIDPPPPKDQSAAATQPATQAAEANVENAEQDTREASYNRAMYEETLRWALPACRFFAVVAVLLAVLTFMFAVKLAIIGRLGGIANYMSAFLWSLILLAMVMPWQQVLGSSFASGVLFNLGELTSYVEKIKSSWGASTPGPLEVALYYARFIAYPVIALLVWLVVMVKFAAAYRAGFSAMQAAMPAAAPPTDVV